MQFCPLWQFAARHYSQNGEDGILYYLLQWIGTDSRIVVEICCGNGKECNSANLILSHGFQGFLFDGDYSRMQYATSFFKEQNAIDRTTLIHAWITLNNLSSLFEKYHIPVHVDVLSIDVDGMDFWILRHLLQYSLCRPRVIVVEYQDILGPDKSCTVPYHEEFCAWDYDSYMGPNYAGASLKAFRRLLSRHGYIFMGCEPLGFNAFFVMESELRDTPYCPFDENCVFQIPKVQEGIRQRFPRTQHLPWVPIDEHGEPQK